MLKEITVIILCVFVLRINSCDFKFISIVNTNSNKSMLMQSYFNELMLSIFKSVGYSIELEVDCLKKNEEIKMQDDIAGYFLHHMLLKNEKNFAYSSFPLYKKFIICIKNNNDNNIFRNDKGLKNNVKIGLAIENCDNIIIDHLKTIYKPIVIANKEIVWKYFLENMIDVIMLIQNDTKPCSYYTCDVMIKQKSYTSFCMDTIDYFVGFNKGYANLNNVKKLFDKGIVIIKLNGTYDKITKKYYNWF